MKIKKFMLVVAIVCAAVAMQAAQISWTSNNMLFCDDVGNPTGVMTGGQLVLVTLGSSINWSNASVIPTDTSKNPGTTTLSVGPSGSKIGKVSGTVYFTYTGGSSDLINTGDYLALMWQDSEGALSKLMYTSGDEVGDEAVYKVDSIAANNASLSGKAIAFTGNFQAPVPEPTSGLLLVVGGALLALRRKHA